MNKSGCIKYDLEIIFTFEHVRNIGYMGYNYLEHNWEIKNKLISLFVCVQGESMWPLWKFWWQSE